MNLKTVPVSVQTPPPAPPTALASAKPQAAEDTRLRDTFNQFVGQAFFGQLLGAMRRMTDKPAYFHGGRAEEIFQRQLDELLAEKLSESSGERLAEPMYELFALGRK